MRDRLRVLVSLAGFWWLFFEASRLLFLGYDAPRPLAWTNLALTFVHGLRLDWAGIAYLIILPTLLLAASAVDRLIPVCRASIRGFTGLAIVLLSFLVVADFEIYRQWGRRIDAGIVPYFKTPVELWASAGGSPRGLLLIGGAVLAIGSWLVFQRLVGRPLGRLEPGTTGGGVTLAMMAALLVILGRGGLQVAPVNQSSAYFSTEAFLNHAGINPAWNFFDSLVRGGGDRTNPFRAMPDTEARTLVDRARPPAIGTRPRLLRIPRPNLLLIVWESGTARAVDALGGVPGITPHLDSLRHEGVLFTDFYAAADRTDKGLAAIISGFPALPRGSILQAPSKAARLPALSRDLAQAGYATSFYYGGELEFANLKAYLAAASIGRLIGKSDFPRASWISKWGAHDGSVSERLQRDLPGLPEPFFTTWLTLSSHEPFEVPGPTAIPGSRWQDRFFNSIAYTDRILGQFIAEAKRTAWWERTLVVVVADHGRRVIPLDEDQPVKDARAVYRIPMLWLGGALAPRDTTIAVIGSQTDIAPTLLGLLGIGGGERYRWGHDLLTASGPGSAYYGFEGGFGMVTPRGSFAYEIAAGRPLGTVGTVTAADIALGRALAQLTYQQYLDY